MFRFSLLVISTLFSIYCTSELQHSITHERSPLSVFPEITNPASGATLTGASQTFTWTANGSTVDEWWIYVGAVPGAAFYADTGSLGTSTTTTIGGLPTNGTIVHVRLWYRTGSSWNYIDSQYVASGIASAHPPSINLPQAGSTMSSSTVSFSWAANGTTVEEWWIYAGPHIGSRAYHDSNSLGLTTTATMNGLPSDGSLLFVRLWYRLTGVWKWVDYQYVSSGSGAATFPSITSFSSGATIPATNTLFTWDAGGFAVTNWWLHIGTSRGAFNLHNSGALGNTLSTTVTALPSKFNPIHVRLWFFVGGWRFVDVQYTIATCGNNVLELGEQCDDGNTSNSDSCSSSCTVCPLVWSPMTSGTTQVLMGVWGTSATNVYAVGAAGTILHYDGSQWTPVSGGSGFQTNIKGSGPNDIYITGEHGYVLHYDGNMWTQISSIPDVHLYDVWSTGPNHVYVVGGVKIDVLRHYDGSTWTNIDTPADNQLLGIWGSSANDIFIVGETGNIVHYDGSTWSKMTSPIGIQMRYVWGSSPNNVYASSQGASSSDGALIHYDGTTWSTVIPSGTLDDINGIWGSSSSDIFFVGAHGVIYHFDGSTWSPMTSGTTAGLTNIWGSGPNDVFAVGQSGTILHYAPVCGP